jgi:dihydrofolate reductase
MRRSLIVAMGKDRVIGVNNTLPWYLPEDLKYFKSVTMGKPIIMGRKTFESIGRPLPGRPNIVITRQENYVNDGVFVVSSVDEAYELAEKKAKELDQDEVILIGGAEIYQYALSSANRLYITHVNVSVKGDTYFPEVEWENYHLITECIVESRENSPSYTFCTYDLKK